MSRILVTGASGLLGANLTLAACDRYDVVAIYCNHTIRSERFLSQCVDLSLEDNVFDLVEHIRPDWIIHCAAATDVDRCQEEPVMAWRYNAEMTKYLATAARRAGSRMVYISTDSVFDGRRGNYTEEDEPFPINVYAKSKLAGEQAAQAELDHVIVIRTNLYGWNVQNKLSLAEWILNNLKLGNSINGFRDVYFTPILVNDLVDVILLMLGQEFYGLYHVAGSQRCSKYEFGCKLATVFGLDAKLIQPTLIAESSLAAPRPLDTSLCVSKVSQALGMHMPDLISGLQRFKALRDTGYVAELRSLRA